MLKKFDQMRIDQLRAEAEELKLSLEEYMLFRILDKLEDNVNVTAYVSNPDELLD